MNKTQVYKKYLRDTISIHILDLVLQKITGFTKNQLFFSNEIDDKYLDAIDISIKRILKGEPLEYVIQQAQFYSLEFYVDPRVLIPRNDSEVMVDESLNHISKTLDGAGKDIHLSIIDIGTGSGCIPISIAKNSDHIHNIYMIDIQAPALEVSTKNIHIHGLQNKTSLLQSSLLDDFIVEKKDFHFSPYCIITANLPYIKNGDYQHMDQSVITHEPDSALYGGEITGFELYEKLIKQTMRLKSLYHFAQLTVFIEIGFDQLEHSLDFLQTLPVEFKYYKDNHGIDRCIKIEV